MIESMNVCISCPFCHRRQLQSEGLFVYSQEMRPAVILSYSIFKVTADVSFPDLCYTQFSVNVQQKREKRKKNSHNENQVKTVGKCTFLNNILFILKLELIIKAPPYLFGVWNADNDGYIV